VEQVNRKILVMGLTAVGKITLANTLAPLLNRAGFSADAASANLSRDLGFSHEDRVEHARRMGWMCNRVVEAGGTVIADFICPGTQTRAAFGEAFAIWRDRIDAGFKDTTQMFGPPERFDVRVTARRKPQSCAARALTPLRPPFDPHKPTALFTGCYQPFQGHLQRVIEKGLRGIGQECLAVRNIHRIDAKSPLLFLALRERIEATLWARAERFVVVSLPNLTNVFYGHEVGNSVERIIVDEETEAISATKMRKLSAVC
jgi:predicted kinase